MLATLTSQARDGQPGRQRHDDPRGRPAARPGLLAFSRGAHAACIDELLAIRQQAHRFGGSHAQRDVLHLTLLEAALRAGRAPLAQALAAERTAQKPRAPSTACWPRAPARLDGRREPPDAQLIARPRRVCETGWGPEVRASARVTSAAPCGQASVRSRARPPARITGSRRSAFSVTTTDGGRPCPARSPGASAWSCSSPRRPVVTTTGCPGRPADRGPGRIELRGPDRTAARPGRAGAGRARSGCATPRPPATRPRPTPRSSTAPRCRPPTCSTSSTRTPAQQGNASELLAQAGFDVQPLPLDRNPRELRGLMFFGPFASESPAYRRLRRDERAGHLHLRRRGQRAAADAPGRPDRAGADVPAQLAGRRSGTTSTSASSTPWTGTTRCWRASPIEADGTLTWKFPQLGWETFATQRGLRGASWPATATPRAPPSWRGPTPRAGSS